MDGNTLAISDGANIAGQQSGSVHVFTRTGSTWSETATLAPIDGEANDCFGIVDAGGNRIIVGTPKDDDAAPSNPSADSGSAYVFAHDGSSWIQESKLVPVDSSPGDLFGSAVSLSESGDTVAVTALHDDGPAGPDQGSVYVYSRVGGSWSETQKLYSLSPLAGELFGFSVALEGDLLLVGALHTPGGGAVYAFERVGTTWLGVQSILNPPGFQGDQFGSSIDLEGSVAVISARSSSGGTFQEQGAAYVFGRVGTRWSEVWDLVPTSPLDWFDSYGFAIATSAGDVIVTAQGDDDAALNAGAAYVFRPGIPHSYCSGRTTSLGCVPFATSEGLPSASSSHSYLVKANNLLPNEAAFAFYGFSKSNLDFHGGKLCVKLPLKRLFPIKKAQSAGVPPCAGSAFRNFNPYIQSGVDPQLTAGQAVRAQWIQRDPGIPFFGHSMTDGMQFTILP